MRRLVPPLQMMLSFGALLTAAAAIIPLTSRYHQTGSSPSSAFIVPLVLSSLGVVAQYWGGARVLWFSTGAMCAFVVLSLWSGGFYFAVSALLLFGAAVVGFTASQRRAAVPLFWLVGATGVCLVFVLKAWLADSVWVTGDLTYIRARSVSLVVRSGAALFPVICAAVAFLELRRRPH